MQLAGRQWAVSAVAVICFCGCLFQLSTCPLCACEPSGGAGKLRSTRMWAELEGRKWGGGGRLGAKAVPWWKAFFFFF